ncbi:MAG: hypothetical protein COV52_03235 [Gammaproteobacteria bacterium CG11_big_fil_rev_8_21_14_0_20_46_22]|nr:MAG: hypothetical protein COW05_00865 [Gammaproteobacteria bacterium CG12_big_fil_rev_8_21_14_0_65_46_12]PIR11558.1 MAG: hypothetical protein COV52_03235 [Gammaproteobacteria bacterium CG11_big_fil_rev_8_21_14_0_20_46_22]
MNNDNLQLANAYYTAMKEKNAAEMEKLLSNDIHLLTPLAETRGKEPAITAAKNLFKLLNTLNIRAAFSSNNQTMLAMDFEFNPPIGKLPVASLMTFQRNFITHIELFYDTMKIIAKKSEIFD